MQELISVLIPVYNCGRYLDACLNSLVAQTWQNWEAVLVDDGSTDDSPARCDAWALREPRVRVIHQKNSGVSAARNAGIDMAKGQYLAFVDADDWVEADFLHTLFSLIQTADMAVCCVYDQSDWNEKVQDEILTLRTLRTTPSRYANPIFTNYLYNKLYRMSLIGASIRFPETVRRCEDAYFVQDCILVCQTIAVSSRKLYHYEIREGSSIHRFYAGVLDDELPLMRRQYDLFHSEMLVPKEEKCYREWEFGKILAVCNYIKRYARSDEEAWEYLQRWVTSPIIWETLRYCPSTLGKRVRLLSVFRSLGWKKGCTRLLYKLC